MRDRTKETAEAIDQTRMDMAGVEGTLTWVQQLAERNRDGGKGLNKARFDNTFSPLGFELD